MNEQLHSSTVQAKRNSWKRLGSIPGGIALGCADIGTAKLQDGTEVIVTWGKNLERERQGFYSSKTHFQPIHLGADDGSSELIFPKDIADVLLTVIRCPKTPGRAARN